MGHRRPGSGPGRDELALDRPGVCSTRRRGIVVLGEADPGVQAGLKKMAVKPGGPTGDAFKTRIDADIKTFADVVQAAKLTFPQ